MDTEHEDASRMPAAETAGESPGARIGVIGGSGLYELLEDARLLSIATPYGPPSGELGLGRLGGADVAFLARHGRGHSIPPHRVNYRANVWALASVGARAIVASSAVGSLTRDLPPDTFVVPDQLIDRTRERADTFFDGPDVQHLTFADPFCPTLRAIAADALGALGERFADHATTVVIAGPRFSTRAESAAWRSLGADIVNMTQYPESALAAELGLGYVSLSFVTDADTGFDVRPGVDDAGTDGDAVSVEVVLRRLADARPRIVAAVEAIVARIPSDYSSTTAIPPGAIRTILAAPPRAGS